MEVPYSNRELDGKFNGLQEVMEAHFEALNKNVAAVVVQTTKTNGSVANLKSWRAYTAGFVGCLAIIVLPVMGYLAIQIVQNDSNIAAVRAEVHTMQASEATQTGVQ